MRFPTSIALLLLLTPLSFFSQDPAKIDSLLKVIAGSSMDTQKVNNWNKVAYDYRRFSSDSTRKYARKAFQLGKKINFSKGVSLALNNIGISHHFDASYDSALWYYKTALLIREKNKDYPGIASSNSNMGIVFYLKGQYDSALARQEKSFLIQQQLKDTGGMANTSNNMASVWRYRGNYEKALKLFIQALNYYEKAGDMAGRLYAYNNIGIIYASLGRRDMAISTYMDGIAIAEKAKDNYILAVLYTNLGIELLELEKIEESIQYFEKGYKLAKEINTQQGMATCAVNLGRAWFAKEDIPKALRYTQEALSFYEKSGEKQGMTSVLNLIADIQIHSSNFVAAENALQRSMKLGKEVGMYDHLETTYLRFSQLYKKKKDFPKALFWHKKYSALKDSLLGESNANALAEMQTRFESEKKEKEIVLLEKEQALLNLQLDEQQNNLLTINITLAALGILLLLSVGSVVIVLRTLRKRKTLNNELQTVNLSVVAQKERIEQQNEEIYNNLNLAGQIQSSILPLGEDLSEVFRDHFILFLPKDIVSGDFYWTKKTSRYSLAAVVDCTGHGVPGAYMSLMAYELLEDICRREQDIEPGALMYELNNRLVKQRAGHYFSENPGLDISLVAVDKKNNKIIFCSSRQPLWVLDMQKNELEEIRPEKHFMGLNPNIRFPQQEIPAGTERYFYLFSDGYTDQIGEASRKKLLSQRFRDFIAGQTHRSLKEQGGKLNEFFQEWKGNKEQIDDVTVLGFAV